MISQRQVSIPSSAISRPTNRQPSYADVVSAAGHLDGVAVKTPLLYSPKLDERLGFRLLVKAESLQKTGSFKFRGAYNALFQLSPEQRHAGVVSYSSGNHAQGLAAAANLLGISVTVVMPSDAPSIKVEKTRSYGAMVVLYDRYREDRVAIAEKIAAASDAVVVPSFDDPDIIAGQGTAGLEIADQAHAMRFEVDAAIMSCSGGGLSSGCAIALSTKCPGIALYTAEPVGIDDMRYSLAAGKRLPSPADTRSVCDSLTTRIPGELTFAVNHRLIKEGLSVTDTEVFDAMGLAFDEFRLVVEPGGAAALAAAIGKKDEFKGKTVAVVVSGGNVTRELFARALGHR
ncbi:threonine/serine dehydratase [Herbaspirillum sp. HC18]|nr:threonine/serine dehydratase [Herbaspirillum sp. HC18]